MADRQSAAERARLDSCSCSSLDENSGVVNGAGSELWIEFDLTKGLLVLDDVLLHDEEQRLGLLRAQIDSLKIVDLDAGAFGGLHGSEAKEEVPYIDTNLHGVGVVFAVL